MRCVSQMFAVAVLLCLQAVAADLPAWTDDSSVVLRSDSQRIVAGQEQVTLTAAIFHTIDAATDAQFTFTIQNEHGSVVRTLQGARTFQPGHPLVFWVARNSPDDPGMILFNASYKAEDDLHIISRA